MHPETRVEKFLLSIGYLFLFIGIFSAINNPVTGYEKSIYSGTPIIFWISVSFSLVTSAGLIFTNRNTYPTVSRFLGGLSMTAIVSLPIIRGYKYVGISDALSHLGTSRDLNSGAISMLDIRYPVVHTIGSIITDIAGIDIYNSLLLLIPTFVVVFFIMIPMTIGLLTHNTMARDIGLFSAFLLLPVNFLGVHMIIHPTSQAIMLSPLVFYLFMKAVDSNNQSFFVLFGIVSSMFVLLHPQQAANFIIFFVTMGIVYLVFRYRKITNSQPAGYIIPIAVFTIVSWLWISGLSAFESSFSRLIVNLMTSTEAASDVASRGASLSALGGSYIEVFFKLFFVSFLYCILTALFGCAILGRKIPLLKKYTTKTNLSITKTPEIITYYAIIIGLIPIFGIFLGFLMGDITTQYFRHLGFIMMIVTILGAITIGYLFKTLRYRTSVAKSRMLIGTLMITLLFLSIPVTHPSPYIYQQSAQVPETHIEGFETAFDYENESIPYDYAQSDVSRYGTVINGHEKDRREYFTEGVIRGGVPDHFAEQNLPGYFNETTYLTITAADRIRGPVVYQGFRFGHDDFAYLEREPNIDKVHTNGGFDLYLVQPTS